MEGLLSEEDEKFIMGRPSGYMITARSSNGLDPALVNYWLYKKLATFFIQNHLLIFNKRANKYSNSREILE